MKKLVFFAFASAALFAGCGKYHYEEAEKLRSQGLMLRAAEHYRIFAEKNPSDTRAPQALFNAAGIYSKDLGLCFKSAPLFEKLLRNYPSSALRPLAMRGLFICPDYFPVNAAGVWRFGDSQTGGKNARQEFSVGKLNPDGAAAENVIYAGRKVVVRQKRGYRFSGSDFIERQDGFDTIILKYPAIAGMEWSSNSRGGKLSFKIEAAGLKVKTLAGEFDNCVKISRRAPGAKAWVYEYYAPWTGKVLTSVGGQNFENRVTELISYEKKEN